MADLAFLTSRCYTSKLSADFVLASGAALRIILTYPAQSQRAVDGIKTANNAIETIQSFRRNLTARKREPASTSEGE